MVFCLACIILCPSLSVCLSLSLAPSLPLSLSLGLSLSPSLSLPPSLPPSLSLSLSLSLSVSLPPSPPSLSLCLYWFFCSKWNYWNISFLSLPTFTEVYALIEVSLTDSFYSFWQYVNDIYTETFCAVLIAFFFLCYLLYCLLF